MPVQALFIVPHPPIMVPRIGRGQEAEIHRTIASLTEVSRRIAALAPETIVLSSPHAPAFSDHLFINDMPVLEGDLSVFGDAADRLSLDNDLALAGAIEREAKAEGISAGPVDDRVLGRNGLSRRLDHGVVAPMHWLLSEWPAGMPLPKLVHLSTPPFPPETLILIGHAIARAGEGTGRRVVCVASADLSHRLKQSGPYGLDPDGPVFDGRLVSDMQAGHLPELYAYDPKLISHAGQCGLSSIRMMLGALDGHAIDPEVLSYEGPFGVGYMVAALSRGSEASSLMDAVRARLSVRRTRETEPEDDHVRLARSAVEAWVRTARAAEPPEDAGPNLLERRAGVFVSLHRHGALRGCIGTTAPTTDCVADEIIRNARAACSEDPRFTPVLPAELADLEISVDVLMPPEPVADASWLDVRRYGVIVGCRGRRGLLLPDLDGVDTVEDQIAIACRKAGISPGEDIRLQRFEVERHGR